MGYILPVTNYQYNEYAQRDIRAKDEPYKFVPIQAVRNSVHFHSLFRHSLSPNGQKAVTATEGDFPGSPINRGIETEITQFTGKGKYINKCI